MRGMQSFCLAMLLAFPALTGAEPAPIARNIPETSMMIVIAEGQFEPRSVGSYSLRIYAGSNPRFPYDDFIAGTVRPRNGTVEDVLFADVDGDGAPEIVVTIRSAGTAGYLSADAHHLQGTTLSLIESVVGIAKDADPIRALEAKTTYCAKRGAAPEGDELRR